MPLPTRRAATASPSAAPPASPAWPSLMNAASCSTCRPPTAPIRCAANWCWPMRTAGNATATARPLQRNGHGPAAGSVYLDHRALVALSLQVGDTLQLGGKPLRIAAELVQQPD